MASVMQMMMLLAMTMIMNMCAMLLTWMILGSDDDYVLCFEHIQKRFREKTEIWMISDAEDAINSSVRVFSSWKY